MQAKRKIAIIGPGRLGGALAQELHHAGYQVTEVVSRPRPASLQKARRLAASVGSGAVSLRAAILDADLVWFCVPDRDLEASARTLSRSAHWKGKIAFHSSGAMSSDVLNSLRDRGAAVASVHPLMTFVTASAPSLSGVPCAIEGDAAAVSAARRIVGDLNGYSFKLRKEKKAVYHAWATLVCPLLVAALVTTEEVAAAAGLPAKDARRNMLPIVRQTFSNYATLGGAGAFSGPLVRGEVEVIRRHLQALGKIPGARAVYVALARSALQHLPVENRRRIARLLGQESC